MFLVPHFEIMNSPLLSALLISYSVNVICFMKCVFSLIILVPNCLLWLVVRARIHISKIGPVAKGKFLGLFQRGTNLT